jgi:hypothetical protein
MYIWRKNIEAFPASVLISRSPKKSESKKLATENLDITRIVTVLQQPLCSPDQESRLIPFMTDCSLFCLPLRSSWDAIEPVIE